MAVTESFIPPAPIPFDTESLEGAMLYMLQCCDVLTEEALNAFAYKYARARGKNLKMNYASQKMLPRLYKEHKVFRVGTRSYSLNPMVRVNRKAQDAFWVFTEYLKSVDVLNDTLAGPRPCQLSFVKDGKIYHIVRLESDGNEEMPFLCQLEIEQKQRMRLNENRNVPVLVERYILIFSSVAQAEACNYKLENPVLYGVIEYEEGKRIPRLKFWQPFNGQGTGGAAV